MNINIGSQNITKVEGLKELLLDYPMFKDAEVIDLKVSSEVSEQPKTLEETIAGAKNRARNAFQNCQYSFGLESGLVPVPHTKTNYMNIDVCAIYDGQNYHLGLSSGFEYPTKITKLSLKKGIDISAAARELGYSNGHLGSEQGFVGILTKGRLIRKDYNKESMRMALIHLENPELY